MAEASEHLTHPVLGTLGWLPEFSHWFTQLRLPSGEWLDVIVDPADADRFEFLPRATELFRWAFDNERRVLAKAMRAELLELYNDDLAAGRRAGAVCRELTAAAGVDAAHRQRQRHRAGRVQLSTPATYSGTTASPSKWTPSCGFVTSTCGGSPEAEPVAAPDRGGT